ncbi:MAG: SpoIIIAH-like family protein [Oscillospiraceae bacterium]|nr:SpoIIIAH-like family protein [Oscillospiraceae bacterium]
MKFNMILGKKQIILASLVMILSIAVYLNYTFAGTDSYDLLAQNGESASDEVHYGEAQFTDAPLADEYFVTARLDRKKARDEAVETLAAALQSTELTDEERELTTGRALEVSKQIESENKIETLVKAKGFTECLAFVDDDSVRVVVRTKGLDSAQAAQIKNIIIEETGVQPENISVGEISFTSAEE